MANFIKRLLTKIFNYLGIEVRRKPSELVNPISRHSMLGSLQQIAKNGFYPQTIIDVGAANGTSPLYETFPNAYHVMIEPLKEFIPDLNLLVKRLKNAEYVIAVAHKKSGDITINVHPDLVGSSLYTEEEDSDVNGVERMVSAITLDELCQKKKTKKPYLIKIDTQGSELDVLQGASSILPDTIAVILEVSFFEFFKGGPQFYDCIQFMKDHGFVAYDLFDFQYRLLDGALSQVDIMFVQETSNLRKYHFYASREQREAQTKRITPNVPVKLP
jgi:FkbM family methyltransferase